MLDQLAVCLRRPVVCRHLIKLNIVVIKILYILRISFKPRSYIRVNVRVLRTIPTIPISHSLSSFPPVENSPLAEPSRAQTTQLKRPSTTIYLCQRSTAWRTLPHLRFKCPSYPKQLMLLQGSSSSSLMTATSKPISRWRTS